MKKLEKLNLAPWLLRAGLAFVFAYAGVASLQHPLEWIGYLPAFMTQHVAATTLIKFFAVYELALAAWLLSGKYLRYAGLLAGLTLLGIVVTDSSQFIVTFRDVGLACMALALAAESKS